ncbi:hypothetical protein O1611_g9843 [Lasiodiplodia mahajangana]|uniref:Uncharacterized protein n=1 Tax=Lasiodiplodia mahajangana TaxID=1108764 RepID=A0ACC2J510_9PEZI|nr:hypothetical protein O1611_g9843 [Lasiodiplodia mahajangana]
MDRQPPHAGREIDLRPELAYKLSRYYENGKPLFPMLQIIRLQGYIAQSAHESNSTFLIHDYFDNPITCTKNENSGTWFIKLESLQSCIATIAKQRTEPRPPPFYSLGMQMGDPARAESNTALLGLGSIREDARIEYANVSSRQMVTTLWNKARHALDESVHYNNTLKPEVLAALSNVGRHIENIVCFDLGTFEADNRGPFVYYPEAYACTAHHVFAFEIKEHLKSTYGRNPALIFQHLEYTHDTTRLLERIGAGVFRDNAMAFRYVRENTLVIWICKEGHVQIPVKQIIADFPYQTQPFPVPRAMIWPEEGATPTTLQDVMDSPTVDPEVIDEVPAVTDDSPRTNKLHEIYQKHELPPMTRDELFHITPKLAVYTRKY